MNTSTLLAVGFVCAIGAITLGYADWRRAVKGVFILVLVEGALRKWVLPQASELIYFGKDAILVGAYARYYLGRKVPLHREWPQVPVQLILVLCFVVALGAFNPNIGSLVPAGIGVKNYLMYVPLLFMMPHLFVSAAAMRQQLTLYILLGVPICLLGLAQWRSDAFSVLNTYSQGVADYGATTFGTDKHVRITGTFSYLTGHSVFVSYFFALSIALLCLRKVSLSWVVAYIGVPLLVGNALMSGSRAAVLTQGLVVVAFATSTVTARKRFVKGSLWGILISGIVAYLAVHFLFQDAAEASIRRFMLAGDSVRERTIGLTSRTVASAWSDSGMFGYGVGSASPAVYAVRRVLHIPRPEYLPPLYDNEFAQVFAEVGLVGFVAWYAVRAIVAWVVLQAYLQCSDPDQRPLILAMLVLIMPFFFMSVVLNHVAALFVWGGSGLAMMGLKRETLSRQSGALNPRWSSVASIAG